MSNNYKDSLNLPKTAFPMRANLPVNEPKRLQKWEDEALYGKIMENRANSPLFVLHDGPPYANGHIHIGHALNKILKDFVLRYKTLAGFKCPYVQGWDCHGLPVEHQLFRELKLNKGEIDQLKFRKKAGDYALKFVSIQKDEFKRLGVLGRWDRPYLTLDPRYESGLYNLFADLIREGYIYRGRKPVHWCWSCETALAEAEVEYKEKSSPSIFVLFPLEKGNNEFLLIWTTTPWTLYSNTGVAVNENKQYSLVEWDGKKIWLMNARMKAVADMLNAGLKPIKQVKGSDLLRLKYRHPFLNRVSSVISADFVSDEDGSGFVHIAPGHGYDDYLAGLNHGLDIIMPINDNGRFEGVKEDIAALEGKDIYAANKLIIDILDGKGLLLKSGTITHSYPHCWRCKSPVIFRATYQWFMSIDHNGLRNELLSTIDRVKWVPKQGRERIFAMVKDRPDWCLSRQRYWGVPIPVFYCKACGEPLIDEAITRKLAALVQEKGADVWFTEEAYSIVKDVKCPKCGAKEFKRGEDIVDVWFESGGSFASVLEKDEDLAEPADLYLEGSDQHRGWFQSSLIPSVATRGIAPYKTVLTHGFVVDGEGKKMSKSLGNVISPQDVFKQYGADILRLWVAFADYHNDIKLSNEILKQIADAYRKIRNTFRYLLGNLNEFDLKRDYVEFEKRMPIDKWGAYKADEFAKNASVAFNSYAFFKVFHLIYDFCNIDMSSFYLDILKDRLYVYGKKSYERLSAQSSLYDILSVLVRVASPILVFTSDEVWEHMEEDLESVHLSSWPELGYSLSGKELENWNIIHNVRDIALKELEKARADGLIGSSLEARLDIVLPKHEFAALSSHKDYLKYVFIVSGVDVKEGHELLINVFKAHGKKCQRCWNYCVDTGENPSYPGLCGRCVNILQGK